MPTKKVFYDCNICNSRYSSESDALQCESRGHGTEWPIGLLYGDPFYIGFTFAVANNAISGHFNEGASWACRPNGNDSLGNDLCGGAFLKPAHAPDATQPTFSRMIEYVASLNLPHGVMVFDGQKPIPLTQYLENLNAASECPNNL